MPKKISIVLLSMVLLLGGCAARVKNVTDLPPGVTLSQVQSWDSAVANLHKMATATSSVRQAIIATNKQGVFPDGQAYATTLQILGKIDEIQLAASAVLKQSPNNFSDSVRSKIKDYMEQISEQVTLLNTNGVTGIKNPTSQQQVAKTISEITGAVALILSL